MRVGVLRLLSYCAAPAMLAAPLAAQGSSADSIAAVTVVSQFRDALRSGDSSTVLRLLAPDVQVLEAGAAETRDEYRSHHLPADIEFARVMASTVRAISATVRGDVAWVTSTTEAVGMFQGRAVNSVGAELMVLTRTAQGWQIRAIHWSSRRRPPS